MFCFFGVFIDVRGQFSEANGLVTFALNRPGALNALNLPQVEHLQKEFVVLKSDKRCCGILFVGEGEKAFCAGGDVLHIYNSSMLVSDDWNRRWFSNEFLLNWEISQFVKPIVSIWKGIVMGGGVGLSIYGSHRVATSNTIFAMPETGIGFFPDVGASWFLSHYVKNQPLGLYLGMTGHRLSGVDAYKFGLATHYIELPQVEELLSELNTNCESSIDEILSRFHSEPHTSKFPQELITQIEEYFSPKTTFDEFWNKLKNGQTEFAIETTKKIRKLCPLTVRVWFESFKLGAGQTLDQALAREYNMCIQVTEKDARNFREGVRAQLIDKGKLAPPKYVPSSIEETTNEMVNEIISSKIGGDLAECMRLGKLMYT